jgi:S-layer homology domain
LFRRMVALTLPVLLLAVAVPAVTADGPTDPHYLGEATLVPVYVGGTYAGPRVPSPFETDLGETEYAVARADIQVTYTGFTAESQAAFQAAVDIWERLIFSPKPIHVDAEWANLGGGGFLGSAGSDGNYICAASPPTACSDALAEALCNCDKPDGNPADFEIIANLNGAFPDWYLGTDGAVPANKIDFVSVVLHELGHGLGMLKTFGYNTSNSQGGWGFVLSGTTFGFGTDLGYWDAASGGNLLTNTSVYPNPSTALGTAIRSDAVYFQGTNVSAVLGGARARMYAPATWAAASSLSHLDEGTYPAGNANALMTPFVDFGEANHNPGPITLAIFRDIGWNAEGCSSAPFIDVGIAHPFCLEINWMKDNNISTGSACPGGTCYLPSNNVARQAMAPFMARLDGDVLPACATAPFDDVPTGHTFCKEIKWMKDNGISTGQACPSGPGTCYLPGSNVTRQAMSAFMARLALGAGGAAALPACATAPFSDVGTSHPFCKEIKWMKDRRVSTGFSDGTYRPADPVTRQAMSAFLFRVNSQLT